MNANEHEWMPTAGLVLMRSTIRVYSSPFADLKMVFISFYSRMKKIGETANDRQ